MVIYLTVAEVGEAKWREWFVLKGLENSMEDVKGGVFAFD
jgi:hypothetical protein